MAATQGAHPVSLNKLSLRLANEGIVNLMGDMNSIRQHHTPDVMHYPMGHPPHIHIYIVYACG